MISSQEKIPMLDLPAQHAELDGELLARFSELLASGRFVLGAAVESFESDLARLCDQPHAIGCNSGTDALWLALRGLGVGPGDAVLCPAYTFFATAAAIVRVGARPIFADILPGSFNLDPQDAIRRAEESGPLRAVISVDLFGRVCDLGEFESYCRDREIPIIQDAAQSINALDAAGKRIGARADVACLSFYPTKNLGALGDAGGLVTGNAELARSLSRLRVHGESEPGVYSEIGINSRLDAIQAVALSVKLKHLDHWTSARRSLASHYDTLLAERGALSLADDSDSPLDGARLPIRTPDSPPAPERHTYHRYVVRVPADRRSGLVKALEQEGIASAIFYPRGLHQQPALAEYVPQDPLVETERACRETLALPLFPELGIRGVERVVEVVAGYLESSTTL